MRTNIPDVFSAGDITSFPLTVRGDQRVNIGHWQLSQAQGKKSNKGWYYVLCFGVAAEAALSLGTKL